MDAQFVCGLSYPPVIPLNASDGREALTAADEVRRVLRGGAFRYNARDARCAFRNHRQSRQPRRHRRRVSGGGVPIGFL